MGWERKNFGSHEFVHRFFYHGGIVIRDSGCWEHDYDLVIPALQVPIGSTGRIENNELRDSSLGCDESIFGNLCILAGPTWVITYL